MVDQNFGEEAVEALNTYTVAIGNHAHVSSLKTGERRVQGCELEFVEVKPIYNAFASMVRELKYDVCEMAVATYLQAREAGKPISLLPVVMSGNFHHHSITQLPRGVIDDPRQLAGQRVGVRAYSQTTGLWVRGVLKEDYGVDSGQITWVTTEGPHVSEYVEPPNVERTSGKLIDLLRGGDIAAAILGLIAIEEDDAPPVPVIRDWREAEQSWEERYHGIPINHMLTVRTDVLRNDPEAVKAIYRAITDNIDELRTGEPQPSRQRAVTYGLGESLLSPLSVGIRYAREQELIRSDVTVEEIFSDYAKYVGA
jgi:4,5-dihydroxyphthalate decarboxylase